MALFLAAFKKWLHHASALDKSALCYTETAGDGSVSTMDASFIATVGSVYVASVWSMGNPDLRSALKSRSDLEKSGRKWDQALVTWVSQAKRLKVWTKMWDNDYRWLFPTFLVSDYSVSCALPEISWNGRRKILCRLDDSLMAWKHRQCVMVKKIKRW